MDRPGGGGGCGGDQRRAVGSSCECIRRAQRGQRIQRSSEEGLGTAGAQVDWPVCSAQGHLCGGRSAQDTVGENHATDSAEDTLGRRRLTGRHIDGQSLGKVWAKGWNS